MAAKTKSRKNKSLIPMNTKKIKMRPLALGEVTGHHHSLACPEMGEMFEDSSGNIFVRLTDDTTLTHQEHKPHELPANAEGSIRIATEVDDWGKRERVYD